MRTIERSNSFKRDFKRELKGQYREIVGGLLEAALRALIADLPLEVKFKDHDLVGNWAGCRECHLKPDLLLIYRKPTADVLELVRLGSHSELF